MHIKVTSNIAQAAKQIGRMGDSVRRAAVSAINSTAQAVKQAEVAEMRAVFDRPTPYTLNSLFIDPAKPQRLVAEVYFKDVYRTATRTTGSHYLQPQVYGGQRRIKQLEKNLQLAGLLPAGWNVTPGRFMKLDAYGNMDRGQLTQILSQLRVQLTGGYSRGLPTVKGNERKVIGALRRAGGRYFGIPPGRPGIAPGVYLREFIGNKAPMPVLKFVRPSRYRKRFPFEQVAEVVVSQRLRTDFRDALRVALGGKA